MGTPRLDQHAPESQSPVAGTGTATGTQQAVDRTGTAKWTDSDSGLEGLAGPHRITYAHAVDL